MGMSKAIDVAPRVLVLAVVTFALALALLVWRSPLRPSHSGFKHATAQSCASCHPESTRASLRRTRLHVHVLPHRRLSVAPSRRDDRPHMLDVSRSRSGHDERPGHGMRDGGGRRRLPQHGQPPLRLEHRDLHDVSRRGAVGHEPRDERPPRSDRVHRPHHLHRLPHAGQGPSRRLRRRRDLHDVPRRLRHGASRSPGDEAPDRHPHGEAPDREVWSHHDHLRLGQERHRRRRGQDGDPAAEARRQCRLRHGHGDDDRPGRRLRLRRPEPDHAHHLPHRGSGCGREHDRGQAGAEDARRQGVAGSHRRPRQDVLPARRQADHQGHDRAGASRRRRQADHPAQGLGRVEGGGAGEERRAAERAPATRPTASPTSRWRGAATGSRRTSPRRRSWPPSRPPTRPGS